MFLSEARDESNDLDSYHVNNMHKLVPCLLLHETKNSLVFKNGSLREGEGERDLKV